MYLARANPIRTCLGCGSRRPQKELLRLYATPEGALDADPGGRHGGRGAYICWRAECLWEALRRGRFGRAFRRALGPLDPGLVGARIADRLRDHLLRRLHTARRAGAVHPGPSESLQSQPIRLIALATGASCDYEGVPTVDAGPREALALALQAPGATFAAVATEALAAEIAAIAAARADFLRPPPPRQRGRLDRPRATDAERGTNGGTALRRGGPNPAAGALSI